MLKTGIGFALLSLLHSASAFSQDQQEYFEVSESFARCAATFYTMSSLFQSHGKDAIAQEEHQRGNGAKVASAYIASNLGVSEPFAFAQGKIDVEMTWARAAIEERGEAFLDDFSPKYQDCIKSLELQEEIVNLSRREAFIK